MLAQIQALEVARARPEADLLAAYGALATIEARQVDALPAGATARVSARGSDTKTPTTTIENIVQLSSRPSGSSPRRSPSPPVSASGRSPAGSRSPPRRAGTGSWWPALARGETSLHRVLQVASDTTALPDADVTAVARAVLALTRDGQPVAQRTFTARLRRAVASVDARGAAERHAHARALRGSGVPAPSTSSAPTWPPTPS